MGRLPCVLLGALLAMASAWAPRRARSDEVAVPVALQVELLDRLLWYERSLQKSPTGTLSVLVVMRDGDKESARTAAQLEAQLSRLKSLGGRRVAQRTIVFATAEQLQQAVRTQAPYLLYFAQGFDDVVGAVAKALEGTRALTVSAVGADVGRGAVLSFELASSKPRIVLDLRRARAQQMDFSAQLLRIARVIQ